MHYQNTVREFMTTFGQDCPSKPSVPDVAIRALRVKLILEELLELTEASGLKIMHEFGFEINKSSLDKIEITENVGTETNLVEIADAIADISYVNYGAANAYGIDIKPIEDEVHNSNMTKLFTEEESEMLDPNFFHLTKIENNKEKCILVKNKDGKVQKSPSYQAANIDKLINTAHKTRNTHHQGNN
jgi:predicted HAD superfamily Cof-like phosphohydrolase